MNCYSIASSKIVWIKLHLPNQNQISKCSDWNMPIHCGFEQKLFWYFLLKLLEKNVFQNLQIFNHSKHHDINLYIETFSVRNFWNPTNIPLCIKLTRLYFKGIGNIKNCSKAKLLFHRAYLKKSNDRTFGLLICMKRSFSERKVWLKDITKINLIFRKDSFF